MAATWVPDPVSASGEVKRSGQATETAPESAPATGRGEGSDEGSGVGDGVGGGSWAIAPGAATLRLKAIVKNATVPAWRTLLLRHLLDPLAT